MPNKEHMNVLEGNTMSPLDMLIFFFFILVTIKAVSANIDYWKNVDDEIAESKSSRRAPAASLSRTVRTGRPSLGATRKVCVVESFGCAASQSQMLL